MPVKSSKLKVKNYNLRLKVLSLAFCAIILNFALCTLHWPKAYAEGNSLKIEPSNLQIRATSPSDVRAPFTLTNLSEAPITLTILLKRFRDAGDDTGKVIYSNPKFINEANTDNFLKNIQIIDDNTAVSELTLGPKQKKNLVIRINLSKNPSSDAGQDHYFSVVFLTSSGSTNNEPEEGAAISQVESGIGLPVLLSVDQSVDQTAFLNEFSSPLSVGSGPVPFTVRVKNTGDHFVQAQGVILIKNMFGQTVGKIELPKTNILSGSNRILTANSLISDWKNNMVALWPEKFLLGFYTATLTLAISPDQSLYTRSIHFIALPAVAFGVLVIFLLVGFFLINRIRKKLSQE